MCEDPASRAIMFENKFLPAVMEMLHDADNELCAAVAKVLRAITDGNAENAVMAFELGVVSQVHFRAHGIINMLRVSPSVEACQIEIRNA